VKESPEPSRQYKTALPLRRTRSSLRQLTHLNSNILEHLSTDCQTLQTLQLPHQTSANTMKLTTLILGILASTTLAYPTTGSSLEARSANLASDRHTDYQLLLKHLMPTNIDLPAHPDNDVAIDASLPFSADNDVPDLFDTTADLLDTAATDFANLFHTAENAIERLKAKHREVVQADVSALLDTIDNVVKRLEKALVRESSEKEVEEVEEGFLDRIIRIQDEVMQRLSTASNALDKNEEMVLKSLFYKPTNVIAVSSVPHAQGKEQGGVLDRLVRTLEDAMDRRATAYNTAIGKDKNEDEVLKGLLCDPVSTCLTPTAPTPAELKR
jgi:hypothetical protein